MQKLSEAVYASLFWLISGLLVWLVILPASLICLPGILLVRALGLAFFKIPHSNIAEAKRQSQTSPESRPANLVESLLTSLLLTTLVEVPALLAAVISLQPTKLIKGKQVYAQRLQPRPAKAHSELSTDAIEVHAEENRSDR